MNSFRFLVSSFTENRSSHISPLVKKAQKHSFSSILRQKVHVNFKSNRKHSDWKNHNLAWDVHGPEQKGSKRVILKAQNIRISIY